MSRICGTIPADIRDICLEWHVELFLTNWQILCNGLNTVTMPSQWLDADLHKTNHEHVENETHACAYVFNA